MISFLDSFTVIFLQTGSPWQLTLSIRSKTRVAPFNDWTILELLNDDKRHDSANIRTNDKHVADITLNSGRREKEMPTHKRARRLWLLSVSNAKNAVN